MAVITTRYNSNCLGGFVSLTAIIPFENFGDNFLNPNPEPYTMAGRMKTIYLLHGITGDEKDWLYNSRIERYAIENNIAVIMPDGNNNFYVDNNEMERWGEFIGKELIQVTRSLFPLSDKREDTYIGGLSMGGYGALRNGLKYNDVFSKIIALSSALVLYDVPDSTDETWIPWQKRSYYTRIFGEVSKLKDNDMDPEQLFLDCKAPMKIFMAVGTEDFLRKYNRQYKEFLETHNADLTYYEEAGAHEWDFWDRNIQKGLQWITGSK